MADWIKWKGGVQPVSDHTLVKVWLACDHSEVAALDYPARPAAYWGQHWESQRAANRIKAYQVVQA